MKSDAILSGDGRHRFLLTRCWNRDKDALVVIGLNPSTADAEKDDPTIRKLVAFANRDGFGTLLMLNLFSFRSTDPSVLGDHSRAVLCDSGKNEAQIWETTKPGCWGKTKGGHPRHPLYLPCDAPLVRWP